MSERHRLVTFSNTGRATTAMDLFQFGSVMSQPDSFKVTPPPQTDITAKSTRRYGGAKRVGELHDNGTLETDILIFGASQQNALVVLDQLLGILESPTTQYYYEWRPESTSYSTYFEIRGTNWEPVYRWVEMANASFFHVKVSLRVAPLALGDQFDIYDDFSVDTITAGDYTFDAGAGTVAVAGGLLTATSTAAKRLYHSTRGYTFSDAQVTVKLTTGASGVGGAGVILRADANNYFVMQASNSGGVMTLQKVIGGSTTDLTLAGAGLAANTTGWARLRREGPLITGEWWTTEPTPSGTPTNTATYVMTSAEQTLMATATAGILWAPAGTDWTLDDFRVEPYTYKNWTTPDLFTLKSIPGSAPAKVDVLIGQPSSSPRMLPWGLVSWAQKPSIFNMVWNGDLEDATLGTTGWANLDNGWFLNAGATLARGTSQAKYGTGSLSVTTTNGASLEGAVFTLYRTFRKGVVYTVTAWVRSSTATNPVTLFIGDGGGDQVTVGVSALSTSWQQVTTTWTPTADRTRVFVGVRDQSAVAIQWDIDGFQVYEGTTTPTIGKHVEGRGAYPPFGVLQAEAAMPSSLSNLALTPSGSYLGGYGLDASGAQTSYAAEWFVDPTLLAGDDFSSEVAVEVYAKMTLPSTSQATSVTAILSAVPENTFAQRLYTAEWGSAGKSLILSSGVSGVNRVVRLGTLTFPIDSVNASRWRIKLALTLALASTAVDIDYLVLVPAKQRAVGPTSKAADSTYPNLFHQGGVEEVKIIRSDLSGLYSQPPGPRGRDSGLGGQQIEFPAGVNAQVIVKLSDVVPDDPTSSTYAEASLTTTATLHFAVQPRYPLTRSS